jgi:hypothetical protein
MAYTSESAQRQLLDQLAAAVNQLGVALGALGEAYEEVDEATAATLEERVFRPAQAAYGRGRRTHSEFARRNRLPTSAFAPPPPGAHAADPRVHLQRAIEALERADQIVGDMQDSMLPVEVGDRELRDGLTELRELIASAPAEARRLVRLIGR